ncbi:uncharacterized protein BYT42DRAFT_512541 [Radiomyces spectabilis]|uniref:uncharacterized protein n=1 Tax=Radiomyces spectabilis TaxID=64574 RepID=UPI002220D7F6|nr:uncharacterized protein BYT42DRAFT_512541 [Radiomyces spectabilis]KAI8384804.1 hypothetical protein BYT42DRAFT_512541 [Radiomyces spectabilis]
MPSLRLIDDENDQVAPDVTQPLCYVCQKQFSNYICPRCNLRYCSLACYKDLQHADCTESFYRDSITAEIQSRDLDQDGKRQMLELLRRFEAENDTAQLEEEEGEKDEEDDLLERFGNLDIEKADMDEIWDKLTEKERQEFQSLLSQETAAADMLSLPPYQPWWEQNDSSSLIHDLTDAEDQVDKGNSVPPLPVVAEFESLFKGKPSLQLTWNMMNIAMTYCYAMRRTLGTLEEDLADTVHVIETVSAPVLFRFSGACDYAKVEDVAADAVEGILRLENDMQGSRRTQLTLLLLNDLLQLLQHSQRQDLVRALGHLWQTLQTASQQLKKKKISLAARKAYFHVSFAIQASKQQGLSFMESMVRAERDRLRVDEETFTRQERAAAEALKHTPPSAQSRIVELV